MAKPKKQRATDTPQAKDAGVVNVRLSNYRQSPRKTRLVTDLIRGKSVQDALMTLTFTDKRAALPIKKLIESAYASAHISSGLSKSDLVVSRITVDKGIVMKRIMPRARGSAARIKKRTSHVVLTLTPKVIEAK